MWQTSPPNIALPSKDIHVWKASLQVDAEQAEKFWKTLSKEEKARAHRFRFPEHRDYFIAARGILRALLHKYLPLQPVDFEFSYGAQGKPSLEQFPDLQFNVSHSRGVALFAFAKCGDIGVDIEYVDPAIEFELIAPRFFSKNEAATLLDLPVDRRPAVFFNCWTRKEAFIKAKGGGLSIPLDQFEVTLLEEDVPKLVTIDGALQEVHQWSLFSFFPERGMIGALAIKAKPEEVRYFSFF